MTRIDIYVSSREWRLHTTLTRNNAKIRQYATLTFLRLKVLSEVEGLKVLSEVEGLKVLSEVEGM